MVDAVCDHEYILMNADHDPSEIYDYAMENTQVVFIIDVNRREGIVPHKLAFSSKHGIIIIERKKSRHRLRWEIERAFSILEKIMRSWHMVCKQLGL